MRRLTFENSRGDSIEFYLSPFFINSLTGIGEVTTDLQSQKSPFQDGDTYIDTLLQPRFINLEGEILESSVSENKDRRRELTRICNPKLGLGKITFEMDGEVKEINGTLDGGVFFPERGENHYQNFMITWKCPNPYWKSLNITEEPTFEPLFQFPFEGTFEMGMQRDKRIIINDGDAPAPVLIEFYGPAVSPIITNNTTGEYIKVNKTLAEDEFMRVDTTPGNKSVEFVAPDGTVKNVFNWIDLGSTFFQLSIGENEIEYSADSDIQGAIVNISYNKLYIGI
ncbi:phage tail family protein [Fictibacillus sp. 7GRE50]|uniref:phage tail family protein n=1 Tax=Fictibacillus sp. 7GRE50 TaxID=2745878 RepID=UPI0018CD0A0D|nr:phage tail family protein [Fictibacillus sp. 7GRE50]MBH0166281.1 phage tail family protein [Fictibacillus sp. 7GRE50]